MYRCFILARTIITFELVSIFAPEELRVDPYSLLKSGFLFGSFCGPNGLVFERLDLYNKYMTSNALTYKDRKTEGMARVTEAWVRFQQGMMRNCYKTFYTVDRKTSFEEVWQQIVPS